MSRVSSDDTISQLLEAEQGQATPLINRYRRIASGNLVLDQGDQSHSLSVPESHRKIEFTSDRVDTVSEHSLPIQQKSRTGVPFLNLASESQEQNSDKPPFIIRPRCLINDQWGGRRPTLKGMLQERNPNFWQKSCRTEGQAWNYRFKGVRPPLFNGNGRAQSNIRGGLEFCANKPGRRN